VKKITSILLCAALIVGCWIHTPIQTQAKENVVVVIDPGHGGSNLGANPPGYLEKNMTLVTAMAMKTELEKYQGVTVYMTRTTDAELSLEERAQGAKSVNADFLYSLHYNMSSSHYFYGSEVWAQSTGDNYTKGYAQGQLFLNEFINAGLFSRGVKVRLGSTGDEYYGILRHAKNMGIPATIVEHCFLDHVNDMNYNNTVDKLQAFGRLDATAVAKYFGLSSTELGVNYANYPKAQVVSTPVPKVQDLTVPDVAALTITGKNASNKTVSIKVNAADKDTGIMYYAYTTDGGATWSSLGIWLSATDTLSITVPAKYGNIKTVAVAVFNSYDGMTMSNFVAY